MGRVYLCSPGCLNRISMCTESMVMARISYGRPSCSRASWFAAGARQSRQERQKQSTHSSAAAADGT
jgi:hypothetical protein